MNIGIDFDGVLFDSETMLRSTAAIFNSQIGGKAMSNPEELRAYKRYAWTKEIEDKFLSENLLNIFKKAPIMIHAKEVISLLQQQGHKVYAITNRGYNFAEEIEITNNRLKEENIDFEKIIYTENDKLEVCKQLNIDLMIDDLYDAVDKISNAGIKCLYYRDLVLKFCTNENVKEVRNWGEIYVELNKMGVLK